MPISRTARPALAACSTLLILAGSGCTTGPSVEKETRPTSPLELTVGEAQSGTTVAIAEGGSLTLELPVTSGTGYGWEVRVEPAGLLRVPTAGEAIRGDEAMPGSVTQVRWVLTDAARGRGTVKAIYRRPWEKDVPPAKRFSVSVEVGPMADPATKP